MIDIHSHCFRGSGARKPPADASARRGSPTWRRHAATSWSANAPFRPVHDALWDPHARVARAGRDQGIDVQVVCATPVMFGYGWEADRARYDWAARMNDRALAFCAARPAAPEGARPGAAAGHRRARAARPRGPRRRATSACRSATTSAPRASTIRASSISSSIAPSSDAGAGPSLGHDGRRPDEAVDAAVARRDARRDASGHAVADPVGRVRAASRIAADLLRARRRQLRLAARPCRQRLAPSRHRAQPTARGRRRLTRAVCMSTPRSSIRRRCACWSRSWAATA